MKKVATRKPMKKSGKMSSLLMRSLVFGALLFLLIFGIGYHYRESIAHYFGYETDKMREMEKLSVLHNFQVLSVNSDKAIGFDVSEYQGRTNWALTDSIEAAFPLDFVFIRATAGKDGVDKNFITNWLGAKKNNIIHGAYHYYRPNENSLEQADNFIKTVKLSKGDLPPVLDIEKLPKEQSIDSLKVGLKRWLKKVEDHYNVKPIIYSGESYYNDFLKDEFYEYTFWIANYSFFVEEINDSWMFWQFTEKASIPGISGNVDVNVFNGTRDELRKMTID